MQDYPKTGKSGFRYKCYKHAHRIDDAYSVWRGDIIWGESETACSKEMARIPICLLLCIEGSPHQRPPDSRKGLVELYSGLLLVENFSFSMDLGQTMNEDCPYIPALLRLSLSLSLYIYIYMYLHALAADVLSTLLRQMCSVRSCQTCAQYALAADVDAWEDFLKSRSTENP